MYCVDLGESFQMSIYNLVFAKKYLQKLASTQPKTSPVKFARSPVQIPQVTPSIMLGTGVIFFSLILQPGVWTPITAIFGLTPLMLAVIVGAAQNVFTKSAKYGMFDPCKEIAYIGLNIRSTSIADTSYFYFGLVLGCIDADLCK